jgi:hypothetical protein
VASNPEDILEWQTCQKEKFRLQKTGQSAGSVDARMAHEAPKNRVPMRQVIVVGPLDGMTQHRAAPADSFA